MAAEAAGEIEALAVIGAGVMGRGIAQLFASAGLTVTLFDSRQGAAEEARAFVAAQLSRAVEKGRMEKAAGEDSLARLTVAESLEALAGQPLAIEAVVEDLETKRALFRRLESLLGPHAILASNTSSLSVTAIAAACARPERVAGFHFFNPVPLMRLVEVVPGERSAPEVVETLAALARRAGHRPVVARDTPGFLVNHAGRGYGTEALRILEEGVAPPEAIDRILAEAAGFPLGPFALLDLTGLDVSHPVMESIYRQFYDEPRFRPTTETARRLAAGLLGRKSGAGFYRYEGGARQVPPETAAPQDRPKAVWVSPAEPEAAAELRSFLARLGVAAEEGPKPSPAALALVTPFGADTTTTALAQGLDPRRTLAVDCLLGLERRITLMASPATAPEHLSAAHGLLASGGRPVTAIADSPGFVAQRVLAHVVNVACEIAQKRIARPEEIDVAVKLGLGYPEGPLAWGDRLGPKRLLAILEGLSAFTGDPRYRPSPWLKRRALLGLSLLAPDAL